MIYFTSDTHFGHANIMKFCGRRKFFTEEDREYYDWYIDNEGSISGEEYDKFCKWKPSSESVHSMNKGLCEAINDVVQPDDTLYFLGDFAWTKDIKTIRNYRDNINCQDIHFIFGNHDNEKSIIKAKCFSSCQHYCQIRREDNILIAMMHYPLRSWHSIRYGSIHLYGHVHGNFDDTEWGRSMDVGVDTHPEYKPYSMDEIADKMLQIPINK